MPRGWRAVIGLDHPSGIRAQNGYCITRVSRNHPFGYRHSAKAIVKTVILMHAIDLPFYFILLQFYIQSVGRKSRIAGRGHFAWAK